MTRQDIKGFLQEVYPALLDEATSEQLPKRMFARYLLHEVNSLWDERGPKKANLNRLISALERTVMDLKRIVRRLETLKGKP